MLNSTDNSFATIQIANTILSKGTGRRSRNQSKTEIKHKTKPVKLLPALLIFVVILSAYALIFAFSPFNGNVKPTKKEALETISNSNKLIITSGQFISEAEAKLYKAELKSRLGIPLKILKAGDAYTIQVGPSYSSHEDALIVFDELSRYSVANLSLRME